MTYYLPSTELEGITDIADVYVRSQGHSMAAQRAIARHNRWSDGRHMAGRRSGGLHPNHIAFIKEYTNEIEENGLENAASGVCLLFVEETFQDVLDAVRSIFSRQYLLTISSHSACLP